MSIAADIAWCKQHFDMMREGDVWGVPRSGIVFQKRGGALELIERMPWMEEMAEAAADGRDVPANAEALRAYQDADYNIIRDRFEAAGITVRSTLDRLDEVPACPSCGSTEPDCTEDCEIRRSLPRNGE